MAGENCNPKPTKRQRRTRNLTQSYEVQVRQFITNCHQRNLTKNTIDTYERHLGKFEDYLDSRSHSSIVVDIQKEDIEQYIFVLKEIEKVSPNTVNSVIRHLKAFFTYLKENDIIELSPLEKIKKLRIDEEPLKPFSDRQLSLILSQPDKSTYVGFRDYIIIQILLGTGIRISELIGICFKDLDLQEGSILIRQAKSRKPRIVGIPKRLKIEIKKFYQFCFDKLDESDYVFQSIDGEQLTIRTIQQRIRDYGRMAGITGVKCCPHTFRRTFAISYLKNGGSTASLRQQLGHTSLQIVEKYLYWSDKDILSEHEKYNPVDKLKTI